MDHMQQSDASVIADRQIQGRPERPGILIAEVDGHQDVLEHGPLLGRHDTAPVTATREANAGGASATRLDDASSLSGALPKLTAFYLDDSTRPAVIGP
jgi:hypothetical protein